MPSLAVTIAGDDAPPNAFVVWRGIKASMQKAARLGYHGIELALRSADEVDPAGLQRDLADLGLACPCITTGQVFACSNLYFTTADPARRAEVLRVFRGLIALAERLGAMVNIGRVRGFVEDGQSPAEATERFAAVARTLLREARERGVRLVLEPVNRYEINFVNRLAEGAALIAAVGEPGLALMPDVFHMNIEEPSIAGELERFAPLVAYVHLADSNRLAPGWGHLDFAAIFAALRRMRYQGWVTAEILPRPDPDAAAAQAIAHLRPWLEDTAHA